MRVGSFKRQINVSNEYLALARSDEVAAQILSQSNCYRQACYFVVQSMEKLIRSKIFGLVNPTLDFFREENRTHSLDSAVELLVSIISSNPVIQQQVSKQLGEYVLGGIKYNHLHNNLRYPTYFAKVNSYSLLDVGEEDYKNLLGRLSLLKSFLNDIDKLL